MHPAKIVRACAICFGLLLFAGGCAPKRYDDEARGVTAGLDLDCMIGQMIMAAVPGRKMNRTVDSLLTRYRLGGVILFGHNISDSNGLAQFIARMQECAIDSYGVPLFVSIDQEGGRVIRITEGVTQFPGAMAAGVGGDPDLAYQWGRVLGLELRRLGVNMNLAPVLDVNNNPSNPVINTRSFGSDPSLVGRMGASYIRGLQASRCIAVGKHFPGHGDTDLDSHHILPVIRYTMDRLKRVELAPFRDAVKARVDGIMTAHIAYPAILDGMEPATLSRAFLSGVLRDELGFTGLIITDDLEMKAISGRIEMGEAAVRAVSAGADIILVSSYEKSIPAIFTALRHAVEEGRIPRSRIEESVRRIIEVKIRYGIMAPVRGKKSLPAFACSQEELEILNGADALNRELSRKGMLLFGDAGRALPDAPIRRYVFTQSKLLQSELSKAAVTVPCDNIVLCLDRATRGPKGVLYVHVVEPQVGFVRWAASACRERGVECVLVSTGNPFPLTMAGSMESGILTFSNTDESIRQLALCLSGSFRPRTGGLRLRLEEKR